MSEFTALKISTVEKYDRALALELKQVDGPTTKRGVLDPSEVAAFPADVAQQHAALVEQAKQNGFDPYKIDDIAAQNETLAKTLSAFDGPSTTQGVADASEVSKLAPDRQARYEEVVGEKKAQDKANREYGMNFQIGHGTIALSAMILGGPIAQLVGVAWFWVAPLVLRVLPDCISRPVYDAEVALGKVVTWPLVKVAQGAKKVWNAIFGKKED